MEWIIAAYAALSVGVASHEVWSTIQDPDKDWIPKGDRWHWWDSIWIFVITLGMWPWLHWDTIIHPMEIPERRRQRKAELAGKRKIAKAKAALALAQEGWKLSAENLETVKQQNREQRQSWQAEFDTLEAPHKAARQLEQERKEREEQINSARAALQEFRDNGPVVFESGAKATFYEHGRQLFNLGAKLIVSELDATESNALEFYLQSKRREASLNYDWGHAGMDYR